MPTARLAFPLLACLLLAGCSLLGGESTAEPDKSAYAGGVGFALAVNNAADDPFNVTIRVLSVSTGAQLALVEERVDPGAAIEKWYSVEGRPALVARFSYQWTGDGKASHGIDEQTFHTEDCPEVSRLAWELRQLPSAVGHSYLGKTCASEA